MRADFYPFQMLLFAVSGWLNRHQQDVIAYLVEENRGRCCMDRRQDDPALAASRQAATAWDLGFPSSNIRLRTAPPIIASRL